MSFFGGAVFLPTWLVLAATGSASALIGIALEGPLVLGRIPLGSLVVEFRTTSLSSPASLAGAIVVGEDDVNAGCRSSTTSEALAAITGDLGLAEGDNAGCSVSGAGSYTSFGEFGDAMSTSIVAEVGLGGLERLLAGNGVLALTRPGLCEGVFGLTISAPGVFARSVATV